jgi:hypothetical protein
MKKIYLLLLMSFWGIANEAMAIDAEVMCVAFQNNKKHYLEVNVEIFGKTLGQNVRPDRMLQSGVEVVMLVKQGDKIVTFDKYNLRSPISAVVSNLIDVRRFSLLPGDYKIEVMFTDLIDPKNTASREKNVSIEAVNDKIQQSDIALLKTFRKDSLEGPLVKNGYYMEPLSALFYDKSATNLMFYNELYHVNEDVVVSYHIDSDLNGRLNPTTIIAHKKIKSGQEISPILLQLDISKLPSGYYVLGIDVRNRAKEILSQKTIAFNRSNPYLNIANQDNVSDDALNEEFVGRMDSAQLRYSLKAISCKMRGDEGTLLNLLIKGNQPSAQRRFV